MEILQNTLQPMPIYDSAADWYENRRKGNGPCRHTIVPKSGMIPFYITTDYVKASDVNVSMIKAGESTASYDLSEEVTITQIGEVGTMKSYYVTFAQPTVAYAEGLYYLEITWSATKKFYSDLFGVWSTTNLMHIEYSHSQQVVTHNGSVLMFDSEEERPLDLWARPEGGNVMTEWKTEETVDSRDGFQFVEKRDIWKEHSITFLANENTVDALMMMWMCDTMEVTYAGETYEVEYMDSPSVSTVDNQNLREVTLTWRTNQVVQVNGTIE